MISLASEPGIGERISRTFSMVGTSSPSRRAQSAMNSWSMKIFGVGLASAVRSCVCGRAPVIPDDQPGILDRSDRSAGTLNEGLFFVGLEFDLDHHGPSP